jgi:hypothetical protein
MIFNKGVLMSENRKVIIKNNDENLAEMASADYAEVYSVKDAPEGDDEVVVRSDMVEDPAEATSVDQLEDDVEIFEDGPTAGQVKAWKKMHGEVYVTSISFDKHIIWRVLSRIEYKQLVKKMEQLIQAGQMSQAEANMWNEEAIAELCILYPSYDKRSLTEDMAGLPSLISQEVLEASGFVALEVRQL